MMLVTIVNTIAILVGIYIFLEIIMAIGQGWMLGTVAGYVKDKSELADLCWGFEQYSKENSGTLRGLKAKIIVFFSDVAYDALMRK